LRSMVQAGDGLRFNGDNHPEHASHYFHVG
jgi:hypothetical protein